MRLCVPIPCFFPKASFDKAIKNISSLGFDAAEIYAWKQLDIDSVKPICGEYGVELRSMCTSEFRMTAPEHRSAWLSGLKESCVAAHKMGVGRLITQVGQDTGAPREEQKESIVKALTEAIPILEKDGITVMIEPLNTYVDHKGYYLWSSVEAFDIVREVGHPLVKVVYDIYHQQIMEGNIIPNIQNNLDMIAHLHSAGHPGRHELQFGENDYAVIFDAVDKMGYTGCCGLEYTPLLAPVESLRIVKELYGK